MNLWVYMLVSPNRGNLNIEPTNTAILMMETPKRVPPLYKPAIFQQITFFRAKSSAAQFLDSPSFKRGAVWALKASDLRLRVRRWDRVDGELSCC